MVKKARKNVDTDPLPSPPLSISTRQEKELEVGAWPAVLSETLAPAATPVAPAPAVAPVVAPVATAAATPAQGGGGAAHPQAAERFQQVVLTDS